MSWYKDWFNSEYYLKVYSHRNEEEADRLAELIIKYTQLKIGSNILDMACGSGRHSIAFAKRGYDVTAVDFSENLLSEAKKNSSNVGVQIKLFLSDIREFKSDIKFDLTLNLFTSIGYFDNDEENFAVVQKANELLKKGGYFILDYFNKDFLVDNLVPITILSVNGAKITQNRTIEGNRVVKYITIAKNDNVSKFHESVRLYSFDELNEVLTNFGFRVIKMLGDFNGSNFDKLNSSRVIFIAQK
jgi:2-polyprenyl-3-methyl-5-hydroxy-6-metoxy-1,4-benzoquinol methylase